MNAVLERITIPTIAASIALVEPLAPETVRTADTVVSAMPAFSGFSFSAFNKARGKWESTAMYTIGRPPRARPEWC